MTSRPAASTWLALLGVALGAAALGYALLGRGGSDLTSCRSDAWSAIPSAERLPTGWTIGSTDLNANGMTVSIVGPAATDESAQPPVVYASITCYGDSATIALEENRKGAEAAGATVSDRSANHQAYDVDNPSTGSVTTLFRIGGLVGQIADGGTATPSDLAAITVAVAEAMGDRSAAGTAPGTAAGEASDAPGASVPASRDPSASPFAPALEAVMPTDVDGTELTVQSASASELFGDDPSSRALGARIRTLGGTMDKLEIAQAYDETGGLDVSILGFRLPGVETAKLKAAVVETWLSAGSGGVPATAVTLAGKPLTKVDYGDEGTTDYVYAKDDYVVVIDTSDETLATKIVAALK